MRLGYHRRRLAWFGSVMAQSKRLAAQERLAPPELERVSRERLARLLAHARERSAFYRERIPVGAVSLERVPVLEKAELMDRFDDMVTDPALPATNCSSGSRRAATTSCSRTATA
jgi:phenylacetate-coenzyme A ligase PaaK-like adenylate-forming protein